MEPREPRPDVEREGQIESREDSVTDEVTEHEGGVRSGRDWDAPASNDNGDVDEEGAFERPAERPDVTSDPDLYDPTEERE